MPRSPSSTRARLIQAALELFTAQGFTETTTRQIAELAQVNEVTLFRQFGNKQGLLLAAIEDSGVFTHLGETLKEQANEASSVKDAIENYARDRLKVLEDIPELLRSVVGEAGQYTVENRQALGRGVTRANRDVAQYLAAAIEREQLHLRIPAEKLSSLLNGMLFGYLAIELTSEFHQLWDDRQDFLDYLVELCLYGAVVESPDSQGVEAGVTSENVADLPASLVHSILNLAKKSSSRDYAIAYILFAAGLCPHEIMLLERNNLIGGTQGHVLQIPRGAVRQVPLNQWILGKRYGSQARNPLTQWLKTRKDERSALLVNEGGNPLSEEELRAIWQELTAGMLAPEGQPLRLEQARHTWCVEMLIKGITLEDLSILSGWDTAQLQPFARRAREKAALERALQLDRKN